MGEHARRPPPKDIVDPVQARTHPSPERCDRSHVERARWRVTSPEGLMITLCNYHYRQHQIKLAMEGWHVEGIKEEDG